MLRLERRESTSKTFQIAISVLTVVLALVVVGILLYFFGVNPIEAYKEMFLWPFGNVYGFSDTLVKSIPITLAALGLIFPFQMRVWNIGAEGQFLMGAFGASLAALYIFPGLENRILMVLLVSMFGIIFGSLWAAIPGLMKAYLRADEIVSTIMLNYVALLWIDYLVYGPWKDPQGYNFPMTKFFPDAAWLPYFGQTQIHAGIIILPLAAFFAYYLTRLSPWGLKIKVIGDNEKTAWYAGINVNRELFVAMLLSGALAGLGGALHMMGAQHRLQHGFSAGYGYTAIIVAWLGKLNPWAVLIVGILFTGLLVGNEQLQIFFGIPISLIFVFQGVVLLGLLAGEILSRYRIKFARKGVGENA
ncbi:MAG: ral nucleoside transport system permease protein [Thermotogota bacterium]|nr:ral nucleoside transport system permease protein [Thermotogota bacterium]